MKRDLLFILLLCPFFGSAATFTWNFPNTGTGDWDDPNSWILNSGSTTTNYPSEITDVAQFTSAAIGDCEINESIDIGQIDVQSGYNGTITQLTGFSITIGSGGASFLDGEFEGSAGDPMTINGPFEVSNDMVFIAPNELFLKGASNIIAGQKPGLINFQHNDGMVILNGTVQQSISLPADAYRQLEFSKMEINNTHGLQLYCDLWVNDKLILTDGLIHLNKGHLQLGLDGIISGNVTNSFVVTNDWSFRFRVGYSGKKKFPVGHTLGGGATYAPMEINIHGGPGQFATAWVGCSVKADAAGEPGYATQSPSHHLKTWWTLTENGYGPDPGNVDHKYDVTFEHGPGDVEGTAASMKMAHRNGLTGTTTLYDLPTGYVANDPLKIETLYHHGGNLLGTFTATTVCDFETTISNDNANGYFTLCGSDITLTANVPPSLSSTFTYLWSNGNTASNVTIPSPQTGTYTVTVTDQDNGCQSIAEVEVTPDPPPTVTIEPVVCWTFDNSPALQSTFGSATLNLFGGAQILSGTSGSPAQVNDFLNSDVGQTATTTQPVDLTPASGPFEEFSFECLFRLDEDFLEGSVVSGYNHERSPIGISFTGDFLTVACRRRWGNLVEGTMRLDISLNELGVKSWDYYRTGDWHHIAVTANAATGELSVWVDGQNPPEFNTKVLGGMTFWEIDQPLRFARGLTNSAVTVFGDIDEIALYNQVLPPSLIYQHYDEALGSPNGTHYTFTSNTSPCSVPAPASLCSGEYLPDYPIGHPTVEDIDDPLTQIRDYPGPRYLPGNQLIRNVPWFGGFYLSAGMPSYPNGYTNGEYSYELQELLGDHWHYYIALNNVFDAVSPTSYANYASKPTINQALVALSNDRPDLPTVAISYWPFVNNSVLNDDMPDFPYANAHTKDNVLSNEHFTYDSDLGEVITRSPGNQKVWSPEAPVNELAIDGMTNAYYFKNIYNYLHKPFDLINENGEISPPGICSDYAAANGSCLYLDDDDVVGAAASNGGWTAYTALRKKQFREAYRNGMANLPQHAGTPITWYSVDGNGGHISGDYNTARKINDPFEYPTSSGLQSDYYSTPDMYTRWPSKWSQVAAGANHGIGWVEKGRAVELASANQDNLFSPFVAAGWNSNPVANVRPTQWLGLLKILGIYGAEFYYSCFFEIDPDPRHWAWQAATPSYAQAITSRYETLLREGELLESSAGVYDADPLNLNNRVALRKLGDQYVISGTRQVFTNCYDPQTAVFDEDITFQIPNTTDEIKINIRRQGSTYIYDQTDPNEILFYQLDGWHEVGHPQRWSKDFTFEAEVHDGLEQESGVTSTHAKFMAIRSRIVDPGGIESPIPTASLIDFTSTVSYLNFPNASPLAEESWNMADGENRPHADYHFHASNYDAFTAQNTTYHFFVRARIKDGLAAQDPFTGLDVQLLQADDHTMINSDHIGCISSTEWKWYKVGLCADISFTDLSNRDYLVRVLPSNNWLEIDQIVLDHGNDFNPSELETSSCGQPPALGADFTWEQKGCVGEQIKFKDQSGYVASGCSSQTTYLWDFGNGNTSTDQNPTNFYSSPGTYTVELTVTNNQFSPSSQSTSKTIEIYTGPIVNAGTNLTICDGASAQLSCTVSSGTPGYTYQWHPSSSLDDPTLAAPVANTTTTQSYTVEVTDVNGCTSQAEMAVVVTPADFEINVTGNPGFGRCEGSGGYDWVKATVKNAPNGTYTYNFTPSTQVGDFAKVSPATGTLTVSNGPNGQATSPARNVQHKLGGSHWANTLITLTVTNSAGCAVSKNILHSVRPNDLPCCITNTCKRAVDAEEENLGGTMNNPFQIKAQPNPFLHETQITYRLPEDARVRLVVYNLLGEVVDAGFEAPQSGGAQTYTFRSPAGSGAGIYFLHLEVNGKRHVLKIVEM